MKKSFVMYTNNGKQFSMLSDEQAGKLIKAIFKYAESGTEPDITDDGMVAIAFSFIKEQLDINAEKWEETCRKRSEAGKKGGRPPKANAFSGFEEKAKKADNVNVNDNDIVNENENEYPPISPKGELSLKNNTFDEFWEIYPNKSAKVSALKAWNKLNPSESLVNIIMSALKTQCNSYQWKKEEGRFIPHASTWLNDRRWEDAPKDFKNKEHSYNLDDYKSLTNQFMNDAFKYESKDDKMY